MKRSLHFLLFLILAIALCPMRGRAQSVAINADSSLPDPSAILDIKSSKKGVLVPRMTLAQRGGITTPAAGLLIYQTDNTPGFYYYDGGAWNPIKGSGGGGGGSDPFWTSSGGNLFSNNTGNIGIGTDSTVGKLTVKAASAALGFAHQGVNGISLATYTNDSIAGVGTFSLHPIDIIANGHIAMRFDPVTLHANMGGDPADCRLSLFTSSNHFGLQHTDGNIVVGTYVGNPGNGGWFGTRSNHNLYFFTNNGSAQMTVATNGFVGVGTTNPQNQLQVGDFAGATSYPGGALLALTDGHGWLAFDVNSQGTDLRAAGPFTMQTNRVGIETYIPTNRFQIGDVGAFANNDIAFGNGAQATAFYQSATSMKMITNTDIVLQPQYGTGSGRVGINTTAPVAQLDVEGNVSIAPSPGFGFYGRKDASFSDQSPTADFGGTYAEAIVAIYTSSNVMANQFDAFSDARIKNISGVSDSRTDWELLKAIQVTNYTFKDKLRKGNRPSKKVIAQQVEKVFPQVVSKHVDFIPNVYQFTDTVVKVDGGYRLHFNRGHHLGDTARKLQVMLSQKGQLEPFGILSIPSPTEVVIDAKEINTAHVFVYGEEVPDFRTVDYEGLTTLNISATQELGKHVDQLEKDLALANQNISALTQLVRKLTALKPSARLTVVKTAKKNTITRKTRNI